MNFEYLMELFSMMIARMDNEREKCLELVEREPESEEIRRIMIRSIFSIIEGSCYLMKFIAFLVGGFKELEFTKEEIAMIQEETYYLDERGEARIRDFFPPMKSNLRFAFKILAKVFDPDFELDVESSGFEEFQKAIDIRNRITHPKALEEFDVSKNDLLIVVRAYDWFFSNMEKFGKRLTETEKKERG